MIRVRKKVEFSKNYPPKLENLLFIAFSIYDFQKSGVSGVLCHGAAVDYFHRLGMEINIQENSRKSSN